MVSLKYLWAIIFASYCSSAAAECVVSEPYSSCNGYQCDLVVTAKFDKVSIPGPKKIRVFYAFEYHENRILNGEDGPAPRRITDRNFISQLDDYQYDAGEAELSFDFTLPRSFGPAVYTGIEEINPRIIKCVILHEH